MGAWDYYVLSNDSALDMMGELSESKDVKADIQAILNPKMETRISIHEALLAVEIVDISLNGADINILGNWFDYESWFQKVEKMDLSELKEDAIRVIKVIKECDNGWVRDCVEDRRKLIETIETRLLGNTQEPSIVDDSLKQCSTNC